MEWKKEEERLKFYEYWSDFQKIKTIVCLYMINIIFILYIVCFSKNGLSCPKLAFLTSSEEDKL